jgi:hypothetical protein
MDKTTLLNGFRLNMDYTFQLVADVKESDMMRQPNGFTNHPAFTIGHLVSATALTAEDLGHPYKVPDGWDELFRRKGPGDPTLPEKDSRKYPGKSELIDALQEKYELVVNLIKEKDDTMFEEPCEWKLDQYMPTVGQVVYFQCLMHHAWHIGQLAEWRRMMGYDSALKKLME